MSAENGWVYWVEPEEIRAGDEVIWSPWHGSSSAIPHPPDTFIAIGPPNPDGTISKLLSDGFERQQIELKHICAVRRRYQAGDWK